MVISVFAAPESGPIGTVKIGLLKITTSGRYAPVKLDFAGNDLLRRFRILLFANTAGSMLLSANCCSGKSGVYNKQP
jgi:hypothetical protein